jgi:hypothetical protein
VRVVSAITPAQVMQFSLWTQKVVTGCELEELRALHANNLVYNHLGILRCQPDGRRHEESARFAENKGSVTEEGDEGEEAEGEGRCRGCEGDWFSPPGTMLITICNIVIMLYVLVRYDTITCCSRKCLYKYMPSRAAGYPSTNRITFDSMCLFFTQDPHALHFGLHHAPVHAG